MLRQCISDCPDEVWTSGNHPRTYWRIAYHAIFYTHWYLHPTAESLVRWEKDREGVACLWETPPVVEPYSQNEIIEYIDLVSAQVETMIDALDLDSDTTGFSWYPKLTKLDHQIMNIRHLQGHVGQLSELLMSHGIYTDWVGIGSST